MTALTDGFAELTLETRDRDGLEAFYTECFGLKAISREDDRVWLSAGPNARLGLWAPGEKEFGDEGGRHVHFAFSAAPGELDGIAERLRRAGSSSRARSSTTAATARSTSRILRAM